MSAIPTPSGPLSDGQVELRLAAERDIPEVLIAFQDDPAMYLRLGMEKPPSGAQLGSRSEAREARREAGEAVEFTVLEPGLDVCRGQVYATGFDWRHRRAEIGIWLAPQVRRRGWAARVLRLVAEWLISACGIERVEVQTEPDNEAMLGAAAAAGFVREGVLRSYLFEHGARTDIVMLSLLPSDLDPKP
jgi:RimJ/RimL family protein N-acetyltransferase